MDINIKEAEIKLKYCEVEILFFKTVTKSIVHIYTYLKIYIIFKIVVN